MDWYYDSEGSAEGPHSTQHLEGLFKSGRINRGTLVWRPGFESWTKLEEADTFRNLVHRPPPPLPTAAPSQLEKLTEEATAQVGLKDIAPKRWKLWRAVCYGLLLMLLVFAIHVLGIWSETQPPDPWLNGNLPLPMLAAHWVGYFLPGPALFLVIAMVRNMLVSRARAASMKRESI